MIVAEDGGVVFGGAGSPTADVTWILYLQNQKAKQGLVASWSPINVPNVTFVTRCCFGQTTVANGELSTVYIAGGLAEASQLTVCLNQTYQIMMQKGAL